MQKRYGQLGETFVHLGLITEADVERALARQAEVGGYFGDALVELGLLKREQVHWGLADQYDVPFVQIRPEHIDRAVARRVPAAWAREHLILPVLRDGDTVTAVLAGPVSDARLDEVRRFTGATRIEPALSTEPTLHELIDAVYGVGNGQPAVLGEWMRAAVTAGAPRLGVSVRGARARAWSRAPERLTPLAGGWAAALAEALSPYPPPSGGVRDWPAVLTLAGDAWCVACRSAGDERAFEWSAEIGARLPAEYPRLGADGRLRAAAAAARADARCVLRVARSDAGEGALGALLPALPLGIADGELRSAHLSDRAAPVPAAAVPVVVESGDEAIARALDALAGFGLDALTVDVERLAPEMLAAAKRVAPLVAIHARAGDADAIPADLEVRLAHAGETLIWTVQPPADATD